MSQNLSADYLETLGIVQYVPKDAVIDEHHSAVGQVLANSRGAVAEATGAAVVVKAAPLAARINIDFDTPAVSRDPSPSRSETLSSGNKSDATELITVQFALWQPNAEVLVCSVVEGPLADADEMQFLTNILNATGCAVSRLPQMELVEWPPYPNAEGDEAEVREFLLTLLQTRLSSRPVKSILMMGESAANWLLSTEQRAQRPGYGDLSFNAETRALLLPSLSAMIATPQLKADAWQILKPFSFAPA